MKRLLREAFTAERAALPAGVDVVVVARPEARELAERDGLAGVQAALAGARRARGGARRGAGRGMSALRRIAMAPIVAYQRLISPALPRRCKYEPTCSAYAAQAIREFGILRGSVLAVWRLLRCNPFSHGGFDPVDGAAPLPHHPALDPRVPAQLTSMPFVLANIFQPIIDVFEQVLLFFHDTVGFGWGASIIAMTIVVRTLMLPLTIKQFRSMQGLQQLAPQIKAIQEKYKDDKQRQNQEMMKFYQENKVNPFGSCLPLVLQIPVFISLFYMLRKDLKLDICGPESEILEGRPPSRARISRTPTATRSSPARRSSSSSRT